MADGRKIIDERIEEVKRLVYCALKPYFGKKGYEKEDMLQEAMVGVLTRGNSYDPARGSLGSFVTMTARTWLVSRVFVKDSYDKRRINFGAMSLDAPLKRDSDNEDGANLIDLIPDDCDMEANAVNRLDAEEIIDRIDELDERTARIIRARYLDGEATLRSLAQELKLCPERVRQLEAAGLRRLRVKAEHKKWPASGGNH